jgi:hypothetical protein
MPSQPNTQALLNAPAGDMIASMPSEYAKSSPGKTTLG